MAINENYHTRCKLTSGYFNIEKKQKILIFYMVRGLCMDEKKSCRWRSQWMKSRSFYSRVLFSEEHGRGESLTARGTAPLHSPSCIASPLPPTTLHSLMPALHRSPSLSLSLSPSLYPSIYPSVWPSLSLSPSLYPSIYLSVWPSHSLSLSLHRRR